MIDLHTHLLPGIDDGAQTVEEALKMTEILYQQKVRLAVCTPHYDPTQLSLNEFLNKRAEAFAHMKDSKVTLISGSETTLNDYLFHCPDLSQLCIKNTRYLLVELPFSKKWDDKVYERIEKLIQYYNLIPVIAHIERYPAVIKSKKNLKRLIDMGCLLQLNTFSIINKKSWRQASRYIKHGYIDVLASDCHNRTTRPPMITDAYEKVKKKLGNSYYTQLITNAESIVNGLELREKSIFIINK